MVCGDTVNLLVRLSIDVVIPDNECVGERGEMISLGTSSSRDVFDFDVWEATMWASGLLKLGAVRWAAVVRIAGVKFDWLTLYGH
jgi:hypothetical protein